MPLCFWAEDSKEEARSFVQGEHTLGPWSDRRVWSILEPVVELLAVF
jgi:hypothetical protein